MQEMIWFYLIYIDNLSEKNKADPANVNATGNPNNKSVKVVKNMIIERISGVMSFP